MPLLKEQIAKADSQAEEHSWKCIFSASGIFKAKKAGAFAVAFGQRELVAGPSGWFFSPQTRLGAHSYPTGLTSCNATNVVRLECWLLYEVTSLQLETPFFTIQKYSAIKRKEEN